VDKKIEKWAKVLVDYSCNVQRGEWVYLLTNCPETKPLYDAVRKEVLKKGAHVSDHFCYDPCGCTRMGIQHDDLFLTEASPEQLDCFPEFKLTEIKAMQAVIAIEGVSDSQKMGEIPPWKYPRRMKTLNPLINERMKKRWVLTNYPTKFLAQNSGMTLKELWNFVYSALFLKKEDPVAEWQKVSDNQAELIDFLKDVELIRIKGVQSDLTLKVAGRIWDNCDGRFNFPDGEVFTGPIEDSANGVIFFGDFPIICGGKEVSGIKLSFQSGKVIEASAEKGNEFLQSLLETDEGASYIGELGIGTNFGIQKPTKEILFDEKIGGTIHLALGDGYAETGSQNKSAIHQDIIKPLAIFNPNDPDQAELLVLKGNSWFRLVKTAGKLSFKKVQE